MIEMPAATRSLKLQMEVDARREPGMHRAIARSVRGGSARPLAAAQAVERLFQRRIGRRDSAVRLESASH